MASYPTVQLQPGSTNTAAVKQLQDYLVSQGYMTQAQVNTGYGTYGPQTTAAVLAMQKALGVDYSSGPGYFGPRTLSALGGSTTSTATAPTTTQPTPQNQPAPTQQTIDPQTLQALQFLGFTQDQINAMSPSDKANWAMTGTYLKKQADLGQTQSNISAQTFNDAYQKALQDPIIAAKYADMAKETAGDFSNNLQQITLNAQLTGQQQGQQFTAEQKAFKEQEAAAGRAYSGFRQKAQENLNQQEQGIVQSTRSQIQQQLRSAQAPIEQQYGTSYLQTLPQAQAQYLNPITGLPENITAPQYGGITGTIGQQKETDILNRQQTIFNTLTPPVATK